MAVLEPASLIPFFQQHQISHCLVAYSGGLDSHVLLHICQQLKADLPKLSVRAIHINHGLQSVAQDWVQHCQKQCEQLDIPYQSVELQLKLQTGDSLEAEARKARYQVFEQYLKQGEYLLTAHHANDQTETFLLNLMRGSGVDGLAAMPSIRSFASGFLARPLLPFTRQALEEYAAKYQLQYIHDPSNDNTDDFSRNYIRHEIIPKLEQRWSSAVATINRSVQLQAEHRDLVNELLVDKLQQATGSQVNTLSIHYLLTQSYVAQKALIRHWLQSQQFLMPSAKKLEHILSDVLQAKQDAQPCVHWQGCEVRRFRDNLYAMQPLNTFNKNHQVIWNVEQPLQWESHLLKPEQFQAYQAKCLRVAYRQGGEIVQNKGRNLSLKKLLNQSDIAPWERERLPLVYCEDELIYIPNVFKQ